MEWTLYGPSNPWWLSIAVGIGIAAILMTWRFWWFMAKVIAVGYLVAWRQIGRL